MTHDNIQWKFLEPMMITAWFPDGQPFRGFTRKKLARVACRLLLSDRHTESVTAQTVQSGAWGKLVAYSNERATVGIVIEPSGAFRSASVLPDIVHFFSKDEVKEKPVVQMLYEAKHFRLFGVGDETTSDLVLTVKNRWFRNENNPKFLGLNKEYRP